MIVLIFVALCFTLVGVMGGALLAGWLTRDRIRDLEVRQGETEDRLRRLESRKQLSEPAAPRPTLELVRRRPSDASSDEGGAA